ncbi:MAG: N-acetylglutaminylglutamine amidotransferase [Gammaproteobacteria bacterium]|nr:N-acetylglutaminylglutamine amidotransferase [Gammaproteobacteria bacterium]
MCGICGEIRFDQQLPNVAAVQKMNNLLTPRGPDGGGIFQLNHIAVGHRRLRIMDLSEHAQQPMIDNQLGLGIVYNGAIYNYPELRQELLQKGYSFFSNGDTEVILKAYAEWGSDCVHHFKGMFAFCLWERDSGRTLLVRDRLGIKPLYYSHNGASLRFASTLPALLAAGDVTTDLNPVALHHYMHFHSVVPAPHTIIDGIHKLPPASVMTLERDGSSQLTTYWQMKFGTSEEERRYSAEEWQERVLDSVRAAVDRRLVADVPVGVLLSGGLDSSLLVGLLAELGQQGINTFSVGFESVGEEKGDEFHYSDIIANHYNTEHHKIYVDSAKLLPSLRSCVTAMSEPMVSHDVIGFYLLSQEVSKHVKVVQSGQGADEVFAGYHWYPPMIQSQDAVGDYARVFCDREHEEYLQAIAPSLHGEDYSRQFIRNHFAQPGALNPIDKALRIDSSIMLVDDPVKRVDNMTMAWGLEARVPFLDHELVELAARVPAEYKVAKGGKFVLKEAARKVIPAAVIDRPKGYFPVPALKYIQGEYLDFVRDILTQPAARERTLFQPGYVDMLLQAPEEHITPLRGSKLWQVALLEFWLQTHGI